MRIYSHIFVKTIFTMAKETFERSTDDGLPPKNKPPRNPNKPPKSAGRAIINQPINKAYVSFINEQGGVLPSGSSIFLSISGKKTMGKLLFPKDLSVAPGGLSVAYFKVLDRVLLPVDEVFSVTDQTGNHIGKIIIDSVQIV